MAKKIMFTSTELTTDGTITLELGGRTNNDFTKMTLQVVDGAVSPTAGNITINAKGIIQIKYQACSQKFAIKRYRINANKILLISCFLF